MTTNLKIASGSSLRGPSFGPKQSPRIGGDCFVAKDAPRNDIFIARCALLKRRMTNWLDRYETAGAADLAQPVHRRPGGRG
jgi:hypothetical protein